jgi:hypothetical protein
MDRMSGMQEDLSAAVQQERDRLRLLVGFCQDALQMLQEALSTEGQAFRYELCKVDGKIIALNFRKEPPTP